MFTSLKDAYNKARLDPGQFGESAKRFIADYPTDSEEDVDDKLFYIMRFANIILPHLPAPSNQKRLWNEVDDFIINNKGSGTYYLDSLIKNKIIPSYRLFKDFMKDEGIELHSKKATAKLIYQTILENNHFWNESEIEDFRQSMPEFYKDFYEMVVKPYYQKKAEELRLNAHKSTEFDVLENLNRSINLLVEAIEDIKEYQTL